MVIPPANSRVHGCIVCVHMCPNSNNLREFVTELLGVHRTATNHCRNVGPDLGDIWDGEEIGAAFSRGRERPRYYDYPHVLYHQHFATARGTGRALLRRSKRECPLLPHSGHWKPPMGAHF